MLKSLQRRFRQDEAPDRDRNPRSLGLRFAIKYLLFAGTGFVIYGFPYAEHGAVERGFQAYLAAYAGVAGAVLRLFEPELAVTGTQLLGRFPLQIAKNCDAIEANILLVGALLAFPAALSRRMLAATIAVVLLAVVNVARISSLYFVGVHARGWFDFAHLELWPLLLIGVAAIEFLFLARWLQDPMAQPAAAGLLDWVRRMKWRGGGTSS